MNQLQIDVSEIKSFQTCKRQWAFSSRNKYHIRSAYSSTALTLGTVFHEYLADMYSENIMDLEELRINKEHNMLYTMLSNYEEQVLQEDLKKWKVLEVEYRFNFPSSITTTLENKEGIEEITEIHCVGAVDLVVYDKKEDKIFGVEHKTCKNFKDPCAVLLDPQPRLYHVALDRYLEEAKNKKLVKNTTTCGGIIFNEVRKLKTKFEYKRTLCSYTEQDKQKFWEYWTKEMLSCANALVDDDASTLPQPSLFGCQMCAFAKVCEKYGYATVTKEDILDNFDESFIVRDKDHLDEKNSSNILLDLMKG